MADPTLPNPLKPKEEKFTMESRFLMFFLLMMVVLSITQYFYKPPVQPPTAQKKPDTSSAATAIPPAPAPKTPVPAVTTPSKKSGRTPDEPAAPVQAASEASVTIDTGVAKVVLSNRGGGTVKSWVLKKFKEASENPLDVVNPAGKGIVPLPLSYEFKNQKPAVDLNQALFTQKLSDDGLGVTFEYSNGPLTARKTIQFKQGSYLAELTSEITQNGVMLPHFIGWRGGFGDPTVLKYYATEKAVAYDLNGKGMLSLTSGKLDLKDPKDSKEGPIESQGNFAFAGLQDQYFCLAFLPKANSLDMLAYGDKLKLPGTDDEEYHAGAAVGGDGLNQFSLFAGPKDIEILRGANPKLESMIEWGFFGIVAKPLFLAMNWTFDHVTHNWGWAIVLVTFVINLVLFPFRLTSMKSAKKSAALQPEMAKIKAKYKDLSIRDPKKAEENAEVMELYKKHGINPVGGCLPLMLQLPILWAFYTVLANIIEMRGASWLWVHDLTRPETLAIRMLPVLLLVTQFVTQRMTPPSPGMDPTQQKMMMFMPLIFGYIFYFQASGLVLYWLTGNLVGILSQFVTNKMMPQPPAAPAVIDIKPAAKKRK
jgi:YidC/Oxa1 family membrane protein insertase